MEINSRNWENSLWISKTFVSKMFALLQVCSFSKKNPTVLNYMPIRPHMRKIWPSKFDVH